MYDPVEDRTTVYEPYRTYDLWENTAERRGSGTRDTYHWNMRLAFRSWPLLGLLCPSSFLSKASRGHTMSEW